MLRRLGFRRLNERHLPARSEEAYYSTLDGAYALLASLLVEGRGIGAGEVPRKDCLVLEI